MIRHSLLVVTLAVSLVGAGCATQAPYNPFKVAQNDFYATVKVIALAPVLFPGDIENPELAAAKFESLLQAKLREAGFTVVPAKEYAEIFKRMAQTVGGYFDPVTGRRDESKSKIVREHTLRELNTKFSAGAVLYPTVRVVKAAFAGGRAKWDGASEPISAGGFLATLQTGQTTGTTGALSLVAFITDINGIDLYANGGGIQLVSKLSAGGFSGPRFTPVPQNELFASDERNAAAVDTALGPLVRTPRQ